MDRLTAEDLLRAIKRKYREPKEEGESLLDRFRLSICGQPAESVNGINWPPVRATFPDLHIYRKGKDIAECVQQLGKMRFPPVVDKSLGVLIGVGSGHHQMLRAFLLGFHRNMTSSAFYRGKFADYATLYVTEGHGYYLSTMEDDVVILSPGYRADRFDKDFLESALLRLQG